MHRGQETGRVYWECGISNTLYESLTPKLDQFGVEHAQATFLTILITIAFLSVLSGWLKRAIDCCYDRTVIPDSSWSAKALSVLVVIAEFTILKLPKIENKWLVTAFVVLYFFESYNCTTRCFLSNALSNTTELDTYIEGLKQESPTVRWKVETFHYELRRMFALPRMIRSTIRSLKNSKSAKELSTPISNSTKTTTLDPTTYDKLSTASTTAQPPLIGTELPNMSSRHTKSMFPITRKVITCTASGIYRYAGFSDKTIVGVWSRAPSEEGVPFQKISLSKVLVLSDKRSREDYFRQQSEFVTKYGRMDKFAQFSTSIEVAGYRPRLLVAEPSKSLNNNNYKSDYKHNLVRLSVFWVFTSLGLTVPYRVWFKRHCDFLRVTVVKETKGRSGGDSYLRSWFPSQGSLRLGNKKKV